MEEQAQGVSAVYGSDFSGALIISEFHLLQPLACRKSISEISLLSRESWLGL